MTVEPMPDPAAVARITPLPLGQPRLAGPRLLRALAWKTVLELLFLCALATYAAFVNDRPLLRGALDVADGTQIAGWAHDPQTPAHALEVQLFIDGQFAAARVANDERPDLVAAGAAPVAARGFRFALAPYTLRAGTHAVQVYALRPAAGAKQVLVPLSKTPKMITVLVRETP